MYWFKRKWRQIKRVIDYLPIIWKGYDWDYRYAVELFQHQLKRTAKEIEARGYQVGRHNTANRIRTAVELLEKVYDEEYQYEYHTQIEEKYGASKVQFEELDTVDQEGNPHYQMVEYFEEEYTEAEKQIIAQEKDSLMWESRAKQERAHKLVWQYIEHNIRNWWD